MSPDSIEFKPCTPHAKRTDGIEVLVTHFDKGLEEALSIMGTIRKKGRLYGYFGGQRSYIIETQSSLPTSKEIERVLEIADGYPAITNANKVLCLKLSIAQFIY